MDTIRSAALRDNPGRVRLDAHRHGLAPDDLPASAMRRIAGREPARPGHHRHRRRTHGDVGQGTLARRDRPDAGIPNGRILRERLVSRGARFTFHLDADTHFGSQGRTVVHRGRGGTMHGVRGDRRGHTGRPAPVHLPAHRLTRGVGRSPAVEATRRRERLSQDGGRGGADDMHGGGPARAHIRPQGNRETTPDTRTDQRLLLRQTRHHRTGGVLLHRREQRTPGGR